MLWQISSFPRCTHHVFLSHCAADRGWLVRPVYEELQRRGVIPWLDQEDFYYGRDSHSALRDGLLKSRHVVFFISTGLLDHRRGWCALELAYADLLQTNLVSPGATLLHFALPLFFLDQADPELMQTIWGTVRDRGPFHRPSDGDAVAWAASRIVSFLSREQALAKDFAKVVPPGQPLRALLDARPGLLERVTAFEPAAITPEGVE